MQGQQPGSAYLGRPGDLVQLAPGNGKSLSISDIKGSAQSGNRGLADMLIYKLNLKSALLAKARVMLNPESGDWLTVVASVAVSFKSWFENEESLGKSWRAGRPPSETKFLNLFRRLSLAAPTTMPSSLP